MAPMSPSFGSRVFVGAVCWALVGCAAFYPELKTPVRPAPEAYEPDPAPASDLLYVAFQGATIPLKTRDGRNWKKSNDAPDAFAKVLVDGRELLVTPIQANTRAPTWPNQKRANYRIPRGKSIVVEVWDADAINDYPICSEKIVNIHAQAGTAPVELDCDSGAHVVLDVRPAQPVIGLGFDYQLMGDGVARISRIIEDSPAGRAGLRVGSKFVSVQGKSLKTLDALELQSVVNTNSRTGLDLGVLSSDGSEKLVKLREAAMYVLVEDESRILP